MGRTKDDRPIDLPPELADQDSGSDRLFFERWPTREHRLRRAYPGENGMFGPSSAPPGLAYYMVVTRLGPGMRGRLGVILPRRIDTDEYSDEAIKAMIGE